jgi:hypothetical protein
MYTRYGDYYTMRYPLDAEDLQEFVNLLNLLNDFTDVLDGELIVSGWSGRNPAKIVKDSGQWVTVIELDDESKDKEPSDTVITSNGLPILRYDEEPWS